MRGYSKNGRGDAPQIVVALAVTRDGLPVRVWVFPGNTADVTTVEKVKADLRGWRLGRCVLVGDAGMNSEDNRRKLALGGGKYILGAKMRAGDEVTQQVLTRPGRYSEVAGNLRVKEVWVATASDDDDMSCATTPTRPSVSESIGIACSVSWKSSWRR